MDDESAEKKALAAIAFLEAIVDDRGALARLPEDLRRRLLTAAGRASRPERHEQRAMAKTFRRRERDDVRAADERLLSSTGIREARRAPVFVTPPALPSASASSAAPPPSAERPSDPELRDARKCYVCKAPYVKVHAFYDQLCEPCAELNLRKREQTADLRGRVALVTGARVKIGYHAAIKLLRAGAQVVVTTRFPRDAAARYARESDFDAWSDRLQVHGLDLRHTPSVELFCQHLLDTLPRLDFVLNNACQTVRRPPGFYRHLIDDESRGLAAVPAPARPLLAAWESLRHRDALAHAGHASHAGTSDVGLVDPAALSQVALLESDVSHEELQLFPRGKLDADLQQVDLRAHNSWRATLAEVPSIELLEVHLVNAIAPFVLNARLKPLLARIPTRDAHVVNVSAMEGQFYRAWKTDKHPHTNMAKAALNMMTRTSAADYVRDGIHMNSVDTGWITDEDPAEIAARKVEVHRFSPPLDVVDGAARICDPIFDGVLSGEHRWGLFLKDYLPAAW